MIKSELRKIYLEKQKLLSEAERNEKSLKIAERFFANFGLENTRFLHVFIPIEQNREIDTSLVFKRLWSDYREITIVVPRIDLTTMTLESREFTLETKLVRNRWNIFEPTESELIGSGKIDVVLVPLLCYDERGYRVGYGKGFYDKFLSGCRTDCLKIGLSYFAPIAKIFNTHEFDVKLDYCVTPEKIFDWRSDK